MASSSQVVDVEAFSQNEDDLLVDEEQEELEALVTYEIASYPSDLTLWGIREMWKQGDIVVPEFQRNYVWSMEQASLLIESFLLGLPVPQVFFYIDEENKNLVIDGQQRIVSVVQYFDGYFGDESTQGKRHVFRLTGLDERSPFANKRYEDLDESQQRKLRSCVLRAINIRQLSPKQENTSIYHIFERLNTGGTPLKPQEIRNCVFRGEFVGILRDLNNNSNWRRVLGKSSMDKHQKDVELVLRIFALSGGGWQRYSKPMKEFLNVAMQTNKDAKARRVRRFAETFEEVMAIIAKKLPKKPFHLRGPINTAALDAVVCTLVDGVESIPADLQTRYGRLLADDDFMSATYHGTTDVAVLQTRFKRAKEILLS
jgi:hypothetical protein